MEQLNYFSGCFLLSTSVKFRCGLAGDSSRGYVPAGEMRVFADERFNLLT